MSKRILYRFTWIAFAFILTAMIFVYGFKPPVTEQPGPMTAFALEDGSIALQHPDNWKPKQLAMNSSVAEIEFTPGSDVRFYVKSDVEGSFVADIARSTAAVPVDIPSMSGGVPGGVPGAPPGAPGGETSPAAAQKSAVEAIHDMQGMLMSKKSTYTGFQDGKTNKVQIAGLEGLATDFTFLGESFGNLAMTGRRISALTNERRVSVVCTCPMDKTAIYGPVFDKMVASLKFGSGGGK